MPKKEGDKNMKLVLAEKPFVAQSIAKVLGANNRCDGYLEGNRYVVSWCWVTWWNSSSQRVTMRDIPNGIMMICLSCRMCGNIGCPQEPESSLEYSDSL